MDERNIIQNIESREKFIILGFCDSHVLVGSLLNGGLSWEPSDGFTELYILVKK